MPSVDINARVVVPDVTDRPHQYSALRQRVTPLDWEWDARHLAHHLHCRIHASTIHPTVGAKRF